MKLPPSLAKCWRLNGGRLVRDVALLPGAKVLWLPREFDKVEDAVVRLVGVDVVHLGDHLGEQPADEIYSANDAACTALAKRVADDVRRGYSSCPLCRCRDESVTHLARRKLWCGFCHMVWTVAPPTGGRR